MDRRPNRVAGRIALPVLHNLTNSEPAVARATRDLNERQPHRLINPSTQRRMWCVSYKV
jgi:hypothetical protein